ncbi:MAG TPA: response regulator [Flavobacterium sp.]|jgi:CheY-like chemotaxis protein
MKTPKSIFYLDDDIDDLYFFKDAAEGLGHEVSIFINGNEMLKALVKKTPEPDIIFLDIHMPVLNGEEILHVLKKSDEWKHIPIVMISGAYPKKLVRHYLEAGANYLMKKPGYNDLQNTLDHVINIDWKNFQAYA